VKTIRRELDQFQNTVAVILCSVRTEWWYEVEVGGFAHGETVQNDDGMFPTEDAAFDAAMAWIAEQVKERPCVLGLPYLEYDVNGNLAGPYTGVTPSQVRDVPLSAAIMKNLAQSSTRESRTPPRGV
jgi:hypothetical protein